MNYIFNKSIVEVIESRHSVRNYNDSEISIDMQEKINNYINSISNPFNKNVRIKLIRKNETNTDVKLGTYGVIKGAKYFLVSACANDSLSQLALGYTLEKVILYCTSLGLGTVWLGGTFNKGEFAKAINLSKDEILPIVSPLGYEGGKKSFLASLMGNNNKKRKPYSEIFFNDTFDIPLESISHSKYQKPLEMLRLAPSAVNKQPWRVLLKDDNIHFYLSKINGLTYVDIGIALCHFHLTAIETGIEGEFTDEIPESINTNYTYVTTWKHK